MAKQPTQEEKTGNFLKEAFCIDGEATYEGVVKVNGKDSIHYKLTDSKRGTFYVSISK